MKAYVIERAGGPDVLQLSDIAVLEPGADDVRRAHSLIESDRALGKFVVRV